MGQTLRCAKIGFLVHILCRDATAQSAVETKLDDAQEPLAIHIKARGQSLTLSLAATALQLRNFDRSVIFGGYVQRGRLHAQVRGWMLSFISMDHLPEEPLFDKDRRCVDALQIPKVLGRSFL
jgi:hypothetical protein